MIQSANHATADKYDEEQIWISGNMELHKHFFGNHVDKKPRLQNRRKSIFHYNTCINTPNRIYFRKLVSDINVQSSHYQMEISMILTIVGAVPNMTSPHVQHKI